MHANVRRLNLPSDPREEAVRSAVELVRSRVANRESHETLLAAFLEDDLRECRRSLEEVEAWYDEVLELVSNPETPAMRLIDQVDDGEVLEQIEYLLVSVANLRKRILKVAASAPR